MAVTDYTQAFGVAVVIPTWPVIEANYTGYGPRTLSHINYAYALAGVACTRTYIPPPVKKWNGTQWVVVQKGAYG